MKFSAVFNRIHQNFPKSYHHLFSRSFWKACLQLRKELDHAFRRQLLAIHAQRYPVAMRRQYFNPKWSL
jgi:hypothetical protein